MPISNPEKLKTIKNVTNLLLDHIWYVEKVFCDSRPAFAIDFKHKEKHVYQMNEFNNFYKKHNIIIYRQIHKGKLRFIITFRDDEYYKLFYATATEYFIEQNALEGKDFVEWFNQKGYSFDGPFDFGNKIYHIETKLMKLVVNLMEKYNDSEKIFNVDEFIENYARILETFYE